MGEGITCVWRHAGCLTYIQVQFSKTKNHLIKQNHISPAPAFEAH